MNFKRTLTALLTAALILILPCIAAEAKAGDVLTGQVTSKDKVELGNIKIDIYKSVKEKSGMFSNIYDHSVYTDSKGKYTFTKPSDYCLVQIDSKSLPEGTKAGIPSYFVDKSNRLDDLTVKLKVKKKTQSRLFWDGIGEALFPQTLNQRFYAFRLGSRIFDNYSKNGTVKNALKKSLTQNAKIFRDETSRHDHIVLNITPQKVYWNRLDNFTVNEGESVDIAVPAVFEKYLEGAEGIMLAIDGNSENDLFITAGGKKIKAFKDSRYLDKDVICPINGDIVTVGGYDEDVVKYYNDVSLGRKIHDGPYLEWGTYLDTDHKFEDGMTVETLDGFLAELKDTTDRIDEEIASHPDRDYEIPEFYGYSGIRFRGKINYIYR